MPRPTLFTEERTRAIIERLRAGCTRRAAAESLGVDESTLSKWISSKPSFSSLVTRAEAEAETRNTAIVEKAASGWDAGSRTRTTKTVFKPRKTTYPDGRVVEEMVPQQETTESVTEEREFDWRAALEWLKRRRRDEWGDGLEVRLRKMKEDELRNYILGGALPDEPRAVDSGGDRAAVGLGAGHSEG